MNVANALAWSCVGLIGLMGVGTADAQIKQTVTTEIEVEDPADMDRSQVDRSQQALITSSDRDTSAFNRGDKTWSLVAQPLGIFSTVVSGIGLTPGYYYKSDTLFELDHVFGEVNLLFFSVYGQQTTARIKKFWGNSFYTNAGIGSRTIGIKDNLKDLTGTKDVILDVNSSALGLDFQIGNRWQFEMFSIGCDWIGAFVPLTKINDKTTFPSDADTKERKDAENIFNGLAKTTTLHALRFYLGVSW